MRRTTNSAGVVRALLAGPAYINAVARSTGLNRETVSRVLRRLVEEGLAMSRRVGSKREYTLTATGRRLAGQWNMLPDPTKPARYRRRATVVDAVRYDGKNLDQVRALCGDDLIEAADGSLTIRTLHRPMPLLPGSWAVKAEWGECYPIVPDVFSQTYEPG